MADTDPDTGLLVSRLDSVSIVRIENEWHAFTSAVDAYQFYADWRDYRDCELHAEVPIDVDTLERTP